MAFRFLQWLSTFFNGFLIFLNGVPIFLNGFPLFREIQENLFTARNIQKITIWASYFLPLALQLALQAL
jgi:hypothetical protein